MSKNTNQAGKGDSPRPVKKKTFDENFDKIIWNPSAINNPNIIKKGKKTYKY